MGYKVVGRFSEVFELRRAEPQLTVYELEHVMQGRDFMRWYVKNEKTLLKAARVAVPALTIALFGFDLVSGALLLAKGTAVHAGLAQAVPAMAQAGISDGWFGFLKGDGAILLHFLGIGLFTMIACTFMKFTGRADLIPIFVALSGVVMLIEVISLFSSLYRTISTLLQS